MRLGWDGWGRGCCNAQGPWEYSCPQSWILLQALTHFSVSSYQARAQAVQRSEP